MAKQSPPFNHLAAAKARDNRVGKPSSTPSPSQGVPQRDVSGQFTPSTPKKTSQALSVTTKPSNTTPQTIRTPSAQNVSEPSTQTPQRTSKNISDPSYRGRPQEPAAPTNRIADQMTAAKADPRSQTMQEKNISEKKAAREQLKQRPRAGLQPLNSRNEAGHVQTFQNASKMVHLRNQGREVNQEAGRPQRMALNPRPGQRVHPK